MKKKRIVVCLGVAFVSGLLFFFFKNAKQYKKEDAYYMVQTVEYLNTFNSRMRLKFYAKDGTLLHEEYQDDPVFSLMGEPYLDAEHSKIYQLGSQKTYLTDLKTFQTTIIQERYSRLQISQDETIYHMQTASYAGGPMKSTIYNNSETLIAYDREVIAFLENNDYIYVHKDYNLIEIYQKDGTLVKKVYMQNESLFKNLIEIEDSVYVLQNDGKKLKEITYNHEEKKDLLLSEPLKGDQSYIFQTDNTGNVYMYQTDGSTIYCLKEVNGIINWEVFFEMENTKLEHSFNQNQWIFYEEDSSFRVPSAHIKKEKFTLYVVDTNKQTEQIDVDLNLQKSEMVMHVYLLK